MKRTYCILHKDTCLWHIFQDKNYAIGIVFINTSMNSLFRKCAVRNNLRKTKNSALILEKIHRIDWQSHATLSKSSRIDGKKASLHGSRIRNVQVSVDIANNNAMIKKIDITTYIDYNFRG